MEILTLFDGFGNVLSVVVTALVTWGGTFLFYRQRRESMDIENESKQSEEWRKLYLESQEDSRRKDEKIDELRREMGEMRQQIYTLERQVQLNSIYRCDDMSCPNRGHIRQKLSNIKSSDTNTEPS